MVGDGSCCRGWCGFGLVLPAHLMLSSGSHLTFLFGLGFRCCSAARSAAAAAAVAAALAETFFCMACLFCSEYCRPAALPCRSAGL